MMDVKKLVIGFLVLAVATSASALVVSNIGSSIAANNTAIIGGDATNTTQALITGNAFVAQPVMTPNTVTLFGPDPDTATDSSTDATSNDPNNLTDILANAYLNGLVSTNPSGPETDTNGDPALTPPDNSQIITELASSSALQNVQIPDWDAEAAEIPIIPTASSSAAIASYSTALQNIFNQDFVQTNLESLLQSGDPSSASYIGGQVKSALDDVAGLQTPQSITGFQKSLVKMLVYDKNIIALVETENSSTDPLKTALVLQGEATKYNAALQDLNTELQNTPVLTGLSLNGAPEQPNNNNQVVAFIDNLAGVQTAHAQIVVFDPDAFEQMLITYANNIALQILKNLIIHTMQQTVLKWVQGNGVPRIIQSWGTTLVSAYTNSAVGALNSQMSCISSAPFSNQVRLTLGATYQPSNNNVCAVQFQSQLANNLTKFYNNFNSGGGWLTFGSTMQPDNNYYGSVFFTAQAVANTAQNAQTAAQAKAVAAQGFTGSEVCDDGSDPNGTHFICGDGSTPNSDNVCDAGPQVYCQDGSLPVNDECDGQPVAQAAQGTLAILVPNGGTCADGTEPQVTSPGQVTGQVFSSAINSGSNLVTAANDITGLLNALVTSLLNSLANSAITAANGAFP